MPNENLPIKDAQYGPWIINFASVATANATLLNLTSGQTTTLTGLANAFETAMLENTAAKLNAKTKAATKRNMRTASEAAFRPTAKIIAANPNIDNDLKGELGISLTPNPVGPVVPASELSSDGYASGVNRLRWNRNGNAQGTTFIIEASYNAGITWAIIGTTNRCTYAHTGQTPGVPVSYRVISQRKDTQSEPSSTTCVYSPSEPEVFNLKAA